MIVAAPMADDDFDFDAGLAMDAPKRTRTHAHTHARNARRPVLVPSVDHIGGRLTCGPQRIRVYKGGGMHGRMAHMQKAIAGKAAALSPGRRLTGQAARASQWDQG